jgi:nitroreductase
VTRASTRSPGREWRTNTTRPSSERATHPPPAAIEPVTNSMVLPSGSGALSKPSEGFRAVPRLAFPAPDTMSTVLAPWTNGLDIGSPRRMVTSDRARGRYGDVHDRAGNAALAIQGRESVDINEALYTTRAMRRVRPDPVPLDVQEKILDAAIRAPTGGNAQNWRFLLVDDRDVISQIAPLYRHSIEQLWKTVYADRLAAAEKQPDAEESIQMVKVQRSAQWLADHFEEVPLYLFGFVQADPTGGSIFPAVWSAQLAARAEGVGSSLTVVLGVFHPDEVFEILGVPRDEHWVMACCVSFGYPTGRWGVAPRRPVQEVSYRNHWGSPVGFAVDRPLWPPA